MRTRTSLRWALLVLPALAAPCYAQQPPLHDQLQQLYRSMPPGRLDPKTVVPFWDKAQSNPAPYVAALRVELSDRANLPLLLLDGGMRLLHLSNTAFDRRLVISVIEHFDFQALRPPAAIMSYFGLVWSLARSNENTTWAAFRILEFPDVVIPMRAGVAYRQDVALAYMLAPTDPGYWIGPVIERLTSVSDETSQKSLLRMLWFAQDDFADQEIQAFAKDPKKPPASRAYAAGLLAPRGNFSPADQQEIQASSEEILRKKARESLLRYIDGNLEELEKYTLKLAAKRQQAAVSR